MDALTMSKEQHLLRCHSRTTKEVLKAYWQGVKHSAQHQIILSSAPASAVMRPL